MMPERRSISILLVIIASSCLVFSISSRAQGQDSISATIQNIDFPKHVGQSETFEVTVEVAYNFARPRTLQVSIYDQVNKRLATMLSGALVDKGIEKFDMRLKAPPENLIWNPIVNLYVWNVGEMNYADSRNISIVVGSPGTQTQTTMENVTTTSYTTGSTTSTNTTKSTTTSYTESTNSSFSTQTTTFYTVEPTASSYTTQETTTSHTMKTASSTAASKTTIQGVDDLRWDKRMLTISAIVGVWAIAVFLIAFIMVKYSGVAGYVQRMRKKEKGLNEQTTHLCPSCRYEWTRPKDWEVKYCPRCREHLSKA